jgi:hypothetical protein
MTQPTGLLQISRSDDQFACDLLNRGEPREVVYNKLVERGIAREAAAELLNDIYVRPIYNYAITLMNQGQSPDQVKKQMTENGLEASFAAAVVDELQGLRDAMRQTHGAASQMLCYMNGGLVFLPSPVRRVWSARKLLWRTLGGLVFVAGIGVLLSNDTGAIATVLAGCVLMTIGGSVWLISE